MKKWLTTPERPRLISQSFGIIIACAIALLVAGSGFLSATPIPKGVLGTSYAIIAWGSHLGLIAIAVWAIVLLPLTLLVPIKKVVIPATIIISAGVLATVLLDTLVYSENRFHLSPLILQILEPTTFFFGIGYWIIFAVFFTLLTKRMSEWKPNLIRRIVPISLIVAGQLFTHLVHIWADANYYTPVTSFSSALPLFAPATAKKMMMKMGMLDVEKARRMQNLAALAAAQDASKLTYPLNPLVRNSQTVPYNLLLIEIDAWRFDCLSPELTPNLYRLAERSSQFLTHFSGGNSSRAGNFSLFYGLPGTYWKYFDGLQKPPVLMNLIQESYHDIQILPSATIVRPACMDKSTFAAIKNLRLETKGFETPWQRDSVITEDWLSFTASRAQGNKFFGFLYYDCPTAENSPPEWKNRRYSQSGRSEKFDNYLRAVNYNDSLIGVIIEDLTAKQLLDSTVVVITGDHSQEYDDSKQGFNGHGSSFSKWQMQTPLIISWPGKTPATYTHRTSHNDLVATLVSELFGVKNKPSDYCSGQSLYAKKSWSWLMGESYHNYAIIEPLQVTINHPGGSFEIRDSSYKQIPLYNLNRKVLTEAMAENGRFFGGRK